MNEPIRIIYDGDCPFCSAYVKMLRLRDAVGRVDLVNARDDADAAAEMERKGFDLNEGMAVQYGDSFYYGADAIHRLALLTSPSSAFNRINARVFRSASVSRLLYPIMRAGRNLTLRALGRRPI
ncbi:DCC1-like thiol-disulfide oxidoreductase family protein [Algihabitans albus]|uniref:DCC1-like thiol-disulfide oxidoreductase family protein n=1 Tax=Algihabitans albus TaxID=2164067 RepID=UPI000E5C93CB|nr:DCC1-like thiol-disulfide oxidoreductase family protein [Algihabitans albus]